MRWFVQNLVSRLPDRVHESEALDTKPYGEYFSGHGCVGELHVVEVRFEPDLSHSIDVGRMTAIGAEPAVSGHFERRLFPVRSFNAAWALCFRPTKSWELGREWSDKEVTSMSKTLI